MGAARGARCGLRRRRKLRADLAAVDARPPAGRGVREPGRVRCVSPGAPPSVAGRYGDLHRARGACLAGWALFTIVAAVAIHRRQRAFAELLAFASYAWVSRDLEVPLFLASYVVAVGFGEGLGKRLEAQEGTRDAEGALVSSRVLVLSVVAFAFAWGYVQFAGIQLGLHFMHFDFAAGTFRDPGVTMPRIVLALIYKYAVARGFLLFWLLLPLRRPMRLLALRSLVAVYALRATVLVASLEAARRSFWTPVWVTSELPHVLLALVIVAGATAWLLTCPPGPPGPRATPHSSLREAPVHV
jgi:hypothetical protein